METKAMKVELNAPNRELDFLATNRRKYRKYNPEGVSKVVLQTIDDVANANFFD